MQTAVLAFFRLRPYISTTPIPLPLTRTPHQRRLLGIQGEMVRCLGGQSCNRLHSVHPSHLSSNVRLLPYFPPHLASSCQITSKATLPSCKSQTLLCTRGLLSSYSITAEEDLRIAVISLGLLCLSLRLTLASLSSGPALPRPAPVFSFF